jgi:endonuclease-3 related protein
MMARDTRASLTWVFESLLRQHRPQHWWPGESRFEIMIGAILVQNTSWKNVETSIRRLHLEGLMSPAALRAVAENDLAEVIYSCGYYRTKARKLKAFVSFLGERYCDDLDAMARVDMAAMRSELLGIHGIGPETADDILLYALSQPSFVIDAYTRRIFHRLGIFQESDGYETHRRRFMETLPPDVPLYNEYHALIVRHGADVCRRIPRCGSCALRPRCSWPDTMTDETAPG